jgi:hypothetical protein
MADKTEETIEAKIDRVTPIVRGTMATSTQPEDIQKVAQSILNLSHVKSLWSGFETTSEEDVELNVVLGKIRSHLDATSLVQLTQAALNLSNARSILLTGRTKTKKPGTSAS